MKKGNDTLLHRCLHRKQVAPNREYNQDLDPNETIISEFVGDEALENSFPGAVSNAP